MRRLVSAVAAAVVCIAIVNGCGGSTARQSPSGTAATGSATGSASGSASGSGAGSAVSGSATSGGAVVGSGGGASQGSGSAAGGTTLPSGGVRASTSKRPQAEVPIASQDSCKITSAAAVVNAFGGSVITTSSGTSGTGSATCRYVLTRTHSASGLVLDLSLTRNVTHSVFVSVKRGSGNQSVSGVGQDAYYRAATSSLQIFVRGAVAAMQASPSKTLTSTQRTALRAAQITLGKIIAAQS